jgi:hypothetical protein
MNKMSRLTKAQKMIKQKEMSQHIIIITYQLIQSEQFGKIYSSEFLFFQNS